mmetsp:Transcript_10221/g.21823  ORF Transcript_10221/g.21823 Transcript_10221/m.21823 type:complete len:85 (-) Transcript_10221:30-284(-)
MLGLFAKLFRWDPGMTPEPGEQFWIGKHQEKGAYDTATGLGVQRCKYYCDRQAFAVGAKTIEGGLSKPGHPHWDGSSATYAGTD